MTEKVRISKSGRFAELFPKRVGYKIRGVAAEYNLKSFIYSERAEDTRFVVGEGESYTGVTEDGKYASFETVSANTIGAAGLSNAINQEFWMPAGSYLITVGYYCGYYMSVYKIMPKMLEECNG